MLRKLFIMLTTAFMLASPLKLVAATHCDAVKPPSGEALIFAGIVSAKLKSGRYSVKLENEHTIHAHIAGKMRENRTRLLVGDSVLVEMPSYDLLKGRIVCRMSSPRE